MPGTFAHTFFINTFFQGKEGGMYLLSIPQELLVMILLYMSEMDRFTMLRVCSQLRARIMPTVRKMYLKRMGVPEGSDEAVLMSTPLPNLAMEVGLIYSMSLRNVLFTHGRKVQELFYPSKKQYLNLCDNLYV